MAYQWQDYNQQYQGWNPHMMMNSQGMTNSSSQSLHPQTSNTPYQRIPQHNSCTYTSFAQHTIGKAPPPPPSTANAYNMPQQQYTYGPTRPSAPHHKAAPYIQQTHQTAQPQAATKTPPHQATNKPTHTHSNSNTSDITDSSTTHTYTNSHTNNTNILTHITTCGTNQGNHFRQMDSYRRLL